jgi:hypothetical protein
MVDGSWSCEVYVDVIPLWRNPTSRSLVVIAAGCVVPCLRLRPETALSDALTKSQRALEVANGRVAVGPKEVTQAKTAVNGDGPLSDTAFGKSQQAGNAYAATWKG